MIKKNKKAFTLTEVIATLAILGIILVIAIPGLGKLQEKFKNDYYTQLDKSVLAAGKNYYKDNQEKRPVNLLESSSVGYVEGTLVSKKYIDSVKKYNGKGNCTGKVVVVKLEKDYKYVNCMNCGDYNTIPGSIDTSNYDKNICLFDDSDYIEKGYNIQSPYYIYLNSDSKILKDKLCLYESVFRKESINNKVLYEIVDSNSKKKCPININAVDIKKTGEYVGVIKYDLGKDKDNNKKYDDATVVVFQHDAPSIVNDENINIINGVVYTKGELNIALSNSSTFGGNYNSDLNTFQYLDDVNWTNDKVTVNKENFKAVVQTTGWDKKTTKFRVLGEDKTTKVVQAGKQSAEYEITGKQINVSLDKNGGTGGTSNFSPWIGFILPNVEIPIRSGYKFEGYYDNSNKKYYDSVGGVVDSTPILNNDNISLKAKWSVLDKEKPNYDFLASDNSYNLLANNSNVEINKTINFNVVVAKAGTAAKEVKITYHDGRSIVCKDDSNVNFFNNFSGYKSSTHTRYDCGSISYTTNGEYITKVEIKYDKNVTTEETVTSSINLIVPTYTLTYKDSTCGFITKPYGDTWGDLYGDTWGDLCKINKTGYAHNGWKTLGGSSITASSKVTSDIDVYPVWSANKYDITYNANGGKFSLDNTTSKTIKSTYDDYYILPTEVPIREGYEFKGWYTSNSGGTNINSDTKMTIAGAQTLYAQWIKHKSILIVDEANQTSKKEYEQEYDTTKDVYDPLKSSTTESATGYTVSFDYMGGTGTTSSITAKRIKKNSYGFNSWSQSNPFYGTLTDKGNYNVYKYPPNKDVKSTITANYYLSSTYTVESVTLPSTTKSGYTFGGWQEPSGQIYAAGASYEPKSDVALTALWIKDTYTVIYYKNDGTTTKTTVTCQYNEEYCYVGSWSREGYTLDGWSSTKTGTIYDSYDYKKSSNIQPGSTVEIYARWTAKTYKISYILNGGTNHSSNPTSYTYGTGVSSFYNPTRTGYSFQAWYSDSSLSKKITSIGSTEIGDKQIYAHWIPNTYTVSFDANGGTNAPASQTKTHDIALTLTDSIPIRDGYSFSGWGESPTSTTVKYNSGATYTNNSGIKLYAIWIPNSYMIAYNANGGTGGPSYQFKTHDVTLPLSSDKPTRNGYTFLGWSENSKATTATYSAGESYTKNEGAILYAVWAINSYNVSYNANGGSGGPTNQEKIHDETLVLSTNTPTRTGHTFRGWSENSKATTATYSAGGSYTKNSSITLYAVWEANSYSITYILNGGTNNSSNPTSYTYGTGVSSFYNPTRTGYTFKGWYTDSGFSSSITSISSTEIGFKELYAKWEANTYTLTYDNKGGSGCSSKTGTYNSTWGTLCTPTKAGYTFNGWLADIDGNTYSVAADSKVKGDLTAYATWIAKTFTISLNDSSATSKGTTTIYEKYGSELYYNKNGYKYVLSSKISIDLPTKTGHTFGGYYTGSSGTGTQLISSTGFATSNFTNTYFSADATIYAKWVANTYTLTYDNQSGSGCSSKTGTYNSTWGTLCTPTRTGYTFDGWYTGTEGSGTKVTSSTTVTTNLKVYAKWKAKKVTVTFMRNRNSSDTTSTTQTFTYGVSNQKFADTGFTKTGWTLHGWAASKTATARDWAANSNVTDNWINNNAPSITVYAVWERTFTATFNPGLVKSAATQTKTCTIYGYATSCTVTAPSLTIPGSNRTDASTTATYNVKNQKYSSILTFRSWNEELYTGDTTVTGSKYEAGSAITLNASVTGSDNKVTYYAYVRLQADACGSDYKYVAFGNEKNALNFRSSPNGTITGILITTSKNSKDPKVVVRCRANFEFDDAGDLWLQAYAAEGICNKNSSGDSGGNCGSSDDFKYVSANWLYFPSS